MSNDHKPLTAAEIEELRVLLEAERYSLPIEVRCDYADAVQYGYDGCYLEVSDTMHALICGAVNALPRLLAMLTPPADAEVREAVRYFDDLRGEWSDEQLEEHLDTLLSYIRAAQGQCLTEAQAAGLNLAVNFMEEHGRKQPKSTALPIAGLLRVAFQELGEG